MRMQQIIRLKAVPIRFQRGFKQIYPHFPPHMFRNYERRWCYFDALSSGEEALAGDQTTFPRPSPVERASSKMNVDFRYYSPAKRSLPGGTAPPHTSFSITAHTKKSKNAENDSRRVCLFIYLDLQAAGTDIC